MGVFWEMGRCRPQGYAGPLAITHTEIEAWSRLYGLRLTPWEVDVVKALDAEYLDYVNKVNHHGN